MARKTAAERRNEEYEIEQRIRDRIAAVKSWDEAFSLQQMQPPSGRPGAEAIGEFCYFAGRLQRAVNRVEPYRLQEPDYDDCIPARASADELRVFQTIVPRLVADEAKCKLAVEALQRAIDQRQGR